MFHPVDLETKPRQDESSVINKEEKDQWQIPCFHNKRYLIDGLELGRDVCVLSARETCCILTFIGDVATLVEERRQERLVVEIITCHCRK